MEEVYGPPEPAALRPPVEDLLPLALSRPAEALAEARAVLAADPDPNTASIAHQAAAIVLRDGGDVPAALRALRVSLANARQARSVPREADVRATLGATLVMAGATGRGLAEFAAAAERADGLLLATVRLRWGHALYVLGRHDDALRHLRAAVSAFRRGADLRWEARALQNRCMVYLALGSTDRAEADAVRAGTLFRLVGQDLESAHALHNQGLAAHQRGNLPLALRRLEEAAERYDAIGASFPDLAIDEAAVRLTAGLAADAVTGLTAALAREQLQPVKHAELLLATATATLAAEPDPDAGAAGELAAEAAAEFRRQRRSWWADRAGVIGIQARYAAGDRSAELLRSAAALADSLGPEHPDLAPLAHLLAGRLAAHRRATGRAARHLAVAAQRRRGGPALVRATGWLAEALRCSALGQPAGVLLSCGRGLDALAEHRLTLGDTELRALATGHGRELAELALAEAARRGPRALLRWTERWRATALSGPPVGVTDPALATELAALRDAARRRDAARASGAAVRPLDRELERHEARVRRRQRRLPGGGVLTPRPDIPALLAALETGARDGPDATLVELVSIGGELHVLLAHAGRIRRVVVGATEVAEREVDFARAALRRAAYGRPANLDALGFRLAGGPARLGGESPAGRRLAGRGGAARAAARSAVGAAAGAGWPAGLRAPLGGALAARSRTAGTRGSAGRAGCGPAPGQRRRGDTGPCAAASRRHRARFRHGERRGGSGGHGRRLAGPRRCSRRVPGRQPAVLLPAARRRPAAGTRPGPVAPGAVPATALRLRHGGRRSGWRR